MSRKVPPIPLEIRCLRRLEQTRGFRTRCLIWREVDGKVEVCERLEAEHEEPHMGPRSIWWDGFRTYDVPRAPEWFPGEQRMDTVTVEVVEVPSPAPVRPSAAVYEFRPVLTAKPSPWMTAPIGRTRFDPERVRLGTVAASLVGEMGF